MNADAPIADASLEPAPPAASRPRIWSVFATIAVGIIAATIVSSIAAVAGLALSKDGSLPPASELGDALGVWVKQAMSEPAGLFCLILPGQIAYLACTLSAARLSPEPFSRRLALGPGRLTFVNGAYVCAGTIGVLLVVETVGAWLFPVSSDQLRELSELMLNAKGLFLVAVVLTIAVLAPFVEELLFRGYAQSRLMRRRPIWAAISSCALMFALAHGDPEHALLVFPIGAWFGWVAWKLESTWASMIAHACNNSFSILLGRVVGIDEDGQLEKSTIYWAFCATMILIGAVAIVQLRRAVTEPRTSTNRSSG